MGVAESLSVTYAGTGPRPAVLPGWSLSDIPTAPGYAGACAIHTGTPDPQATGHTRLDLGVR